MNFLINCKIISTALVIFSCSACSQESSRENTKGKQPLVEIQGVIENESVTYLRYNTEIEPCITIKFSGLGKSKQLCSFSDQQGNITDVRTDVAGVDYLFPAFTERALTVTLDLFSYYLDCQITLSNQLIEDPVCQFRDMDD
ncbi:hypothetical protein [Pseudoalteromonas mariniglutinosa]|uniref:hypothetical protein n=1 Tax=Pseudoalteromonas mariniglutinosa TaxID=206042 RepID=UPI00384F6873